MGGYELNLFNILTHIPHYAYGRLRQQNSQRLKPLLMLQNPPTRVEKLSPRGGIWIANSGFNR
jgi:hypothetical protein